MKNVKEFILACFILAFITSCFVANEPPADNVESTPTQDAKLRWPTGVPTQPWTTDIPAKAETKCEDREVELDAAKDQACVEGDSCVVIDRGCCPGEKRVAINWKSLASIKKKLRQGCTELMAAEAQKNNHDICRTRKKLGAFFNESPRCHNKKCVINESACLEVKCVAGEKSCCQEKKCVKDEPANP